jgi:pyrroline-5-carboxylate reductase
MKIGIIGLGNIGQMLAKRFVEFLNPSDIIAFDKSKQGVKKP